MNVEKSVGVGTTASSETSLTDHGRTSNSISASRSIRASDVNCFLRLGYFLDYKHPSYSLDLRVEDKDRYSGADLSELIDIGVEKYRRAVERQFETNQEHVVPLSGGLDSRGILGALLEHTEARCISTYTFGTPGTYDYEIGNSVAKAAGTKHLKLPLTSYKYTIDSLLAISSRVDFQTCLFLHPDVAAVDEYCRGKLVWSGAIIDVFFGRHEHLVRAIDWAGAKRNFIRENLFVKSVDMARGPIDELIPFIEGENCPRGDLVFEHILDLINRQLKFIAPHVLMKGYNFRVLFTDVDLVQFCLGLGEECLSSQMLYKGILLRAFPRLFRMATKTAGGLPLEASWFHLGLHTCRRAFTQRFSRFRKRCGRVNPRCNYIDFAAGLRERDDLQCVVKRCVEDLRGRCILPTIDFDSLWRQHLSGESDHAFALLVLASLELHLKAGLRYLG